MEGHVLNNHTQIMGWSQPHSLGQQTEIRPEGPQMLGGTGTLVPEHFSRWQVLVWDLTHRGLTGHRGSGVGPDPLCALCCLHGLCATHTRAYTCTLGTSSCLSAQNRELRPRAEPGLP